MDRGASQLSKLDSREAAHLRLGQRRRCPVATARLPSDGGRFPRNHARIRPSGGGRLLPNHALI